ncbi:hypothetical protein [Phreatobacter sp. AB_2022a]|uniref:hypothetical protein n=1 Tax=Phreatobacter sp. AB_2022a TaxID=3003134 RepID=UPI00228756A9|nr:hypothetical protein [Phreatobacter sp. AB_2022a]MCZ0736952.1 hypothetical protein [Phreatobacter sp. AB_2022a]
MELRVAIVGLVASLALPPVASAAPRPAAYGPDWHRSNFWPGEYPGGFTLDDDVTISIRNRPDPQAPATLTCRMRRGATYHPWNAARNASDGLRYVTYTKTASYRVSTPFTARVSDSRGARTLDLPAGATWTYLAGLAEGQFRFRYDGRTYTGSQELFDKSVEVDAGARVPDDEWLQLRCANGARGWLLLRDVRGRAGFGSPNITDYGKAADRR